MISNKLKVIRTERGMSISELARRSGLSRVTIYNLEKRSITPNLETAMSISRVFNLKVDEIFFTLSVNHELQRVGG